MVAGGRGAAPACGVEPDDHADDALAPPRRVPPRASTCRDHQRRGRRVANGLAAPHGLRGPAAESIRPGPRGRVRSLVAFIEARPAAPGGRGPAVRPALGRRSRARARSTACSSGSAALPVRAARHRPPDARRAVASEPGRHNTSCSTSIRSTGRRRPSCSTRCSRRRPRRPRRPAARSQRWQPVLPRGARVPARGLPGYSTPYAGATWTWPATLTRMPATSGVS